MSETTPPALSGLNAQQMREQYTLEIGAEVPAELTSAALVREALEAHRAKANAPVVAPTAAKTPDLLTKYDADGRQHDFPRQLWEQLGESGQKDFTDKVAKPSEKLD